MLRTIVLASLFAVPVANAEDAPYSGQQNRAISSFSQADIEQLRAGDGWGLAKPAELNGWPGPRHVLDLAEDLALSTDQKTRIEAIFSAMNARARVLGAELLDREAALDQAFQIGDISADQLASMLESAAQARRDLRRVHLAAHLETAPLLTRHQKVVYAKLRGYDDDPTNHGQHGDKAHD